MLRSGFEGLGAVGVGFADDVLRAAFGFEVSFGEVFANDAEEKELDAADEDNDASEARPAGDGIAESEGLDDDDDDHDEGDETKEDAEESSESEGNGGESNDAFDGVFEEFPEGPFGLAGGTLDVFILEPFSLEADELPDAFRITVVLGASDNRVDDRTGHEAVVAGAVDHFDFADGIDEFVKDASAETADGRLAFAGDATGGDAVVIFEERKHVGEESRRVLAVGVHDGDVVASGVLKASEHGGLFAEIAREREVFDTRVGMAERFKLSKSVVATAVVDENELETVILESGHDRSDFAIKNREGFALVVARDDDTD